MNDEIIKPAGPEKELPGLFGLFRSSLLVYRKRFPSFIPILLLFTVPLALVSYIGAGALSEAGEKGAFEGGAVLAGFAVAFLLSILGQIAFIYAIAFEGLSMGEVFGRSAERFFSFFKVYLLYALIIFSGLVFLVIPGIIFSIWFGFAPFILAREDVRGVDALLKSKEYVKGNWSRVFGLLLAVWLVSFALSLIPYAGHILSIFFIPFVLVYEYLLYEGLKERKGGDFAFQPSRSDRISWLVIGSLGLLIFIVLGLLLIRTRPEVPEIIITPTEQV